MTSRPAQPLAAANSGPSEGAPGASRSDFRLPASIADAIERCWLNAAAPGAWNLSRARFEAALARSVAHRFSDAPEQLKPATIRSYLEGLRHADLALACACSAGSEAAWEFFVAHYRQELYRAAHAVIGDTGTAGSDAKELADSLYADLYGLRETEGRRRSLFDYFHGRSKLGTWLRAILAQHHVDAIRRARRLEPLEDASGNEGGDTSYQMPATADAAAVAGSSPGDRPDPERSRYLSFLQAALTAAVAALEPRDRLRLAYYYSDERTLAEIGGLLGEHEATVSRKLERTRRDLRERVDTALRDGKHLSPAQMDLCYEYARQEWPFDLSEPLRNTLAAKADRAGGLP
ncbi:MAG TPA: sigma-70 family RNA polymerase sigma factor [Candidatus Aquilonibacter sp.]|nr:sigma-70 family RNA polymerase sigma factor [Candidatus Aquilonibacter sp.]